jgi:hypothetical protein
VRNSYDGAKDSGEHRTPLLAVTRLATSTTARHLGRQSAGMRALLLATLFLAAPALAESAEPVVCFTLGQDCSGLIVKQVQVYIAA